MNAELMPTGTQSDPGAHLVEPIDEHNRTLVENVHPEGWINPTPDGRYNLVVIGAGTAGLVAAAGAAGLGGKVALIERNLMGGDCLNYGCVPSKGLLAASQVAHELRHAGEFGVQVQGEITIDFAAAAERMRRLRASISHHDSAERFRSLGVDVYLGSGRFVAKDAIEVAGQRLEFSRALIATGARAVNLPIPGIEEAGVFTNESIYDLTERPDRLVVIGAGPIGCELAQAFVRFGSEVTLVNLDARILPREDEAASELLLQQLESEGVRVLSDTKTEGIERRGDEKVVTVERAGEASEIVADAVLVAAGRKPNIDSMGLEVAGVETDRQGVEVDDKLRTSNKRIFAAGDVCSRYQFTHAADAMARIVLQNALFFGRKKVSSLTIPWATYTDPEVAHVGYYHAEAVAAGHDVGVAKVPFADIDRALLEGQTTGYAEVLYDKRNKGRILGATIVARHAGEMIGQLSLAMTAGLGLGHFAQTIYPYPTQTEVLKRLGDAYSRTRLTDRVKRFFVWLLKMRR